MPHEEEASQKKEPGPAGNSGAGVTLMASPVAGVARKYLAIADIRDM